MEAPQIRPTRRVRPLGTVLPAILLTLSAVAGASAQRPVSTDAAPARSGFHLSIGIGSASMGATCDACTSNFFENRIDGFSGVLQLGGAVTPQLVITGEFLGWVSNDEPFFRRVAGLSIAFLGYPSASSGFFVKGGAGGVRAIVENDAVVVQTDAWMGITGVGYDIPVSASAMITPYLNYVRSFGGATHANGVLSPVAVMPNAVQLGIALTVH